ncbi:hypothetical protein ACFYM2_27465 [Streptomyces sp. NPDC006711]|uniref:hypothetical protein n=1 Tax=Streptomyces sp. NPDC006711 TaxID=3364762 RepID=UPI0036991AD6
MSEKQPPSRGASGDEVPDEVWERFLRDSELDIKASAAPQEPSARARMVAGRQREERAAAKARGGGRRNKRRPAEPAGWRTGPAWHETNGRAARRRRVRGLVGVLLALGLLLVALNPGRALSLLTGKDSAGGTAATPLAAETGAPTGAPPSFDPDRPTLKEPFRGSPAAQYADGAAGIEPPEATAVGGLSKERISAALADTRALLIDANLNPATLRGERPVAALGRIDPLEKETIDDLSAGLDRPDKDHDPLTFVTRFDPKEVALVGNVVKTRGRMSLDARPGGGAVVHTDYTFVYPLVKAAPGSTEVARTIVRRTLDVEVLDPAVTESTEGRLWLGTRRVDIANTACGVRDGYAHPHFDGTPREGAEPSGATVDPYDLNRPLPEGTGACRVLSRL